MGGKAREGPNGKGCHWLICKLFPGNGLRVFCGGLVFVADVANWQHGALAGFRMLRFRYAAKPAGGEGALGAVGRLPTESGK